jgi:hypothetical protein
MISLLNNAPITDIQLSLSIDDILRGQGVDPEVIHKSKPLLNLASERALAEGTSLLRPIALTCESLVHEHRHERIFMEGNVTLTGPLVTRHLSGSLRVVAVICTIGPELEEAVSKLLAEDPLYALALDGLGNAAVEQMAQKVCSGIADLVQAEGLQASTPLSPGNPEWPVEIGQAQIFGMFDPSQAGIRLTSGGMMIPKKSMSFVVGLGPEMSQANMCEVCSLNGTCRYGHA